MSGGSAAAAAERRLVRVAAGGAEALVWAEVASAVREILSTGHTLHEWAATRPERTTFAGRGLAYAAALPGCDWRVVVRHNRHGGLLARFTGDRFLAPTRAPRELLVSQFLEGARVPTPAVVGYATYDAGPLLRRVDVMTLEIPASRDLAHVLVHDGETARREALDATATLVRVLSAAGARHHDLNAKNVLLTFAGGAARAHVLDVDRVELGVAPAGAREANLARLERSLRKWRDRWGAHVSEDDVRRVAAAVTAA